MNENKLLNITRIKESNEIEFKNTFNDDCIKSIAAFTNAAKLFNNKYK